MKLDDIKDKIIDFFYIIAEPIGYVGAGLGITAILWVPLIILYIIWMAWLEGTLQVIDLGVFALLWLLWAAYMKSMGKEPFISYKKVYEAKKDGKTDREKPKPRGKRESDDSETP